MVTKTRDLIAITASALRADYREYRDKAVAEGMLYEPPTKDTLYALWAEAHAARPEKLYASWYKTATDRQITKVLNLAIKGGL